MEPTLNRQLRAGSRRRGLLCIRDAGPSCFPDAGRPSLITTDLQIRKQEYVTHADDRRTVVARFGEKTVRRITLTGRGHPDPRVLAGKAALDTRVQWLRGRVIGDAARDSDALENLGQLGSDRTLCAIAGMPLLCACGLSASAVPSHSLSREQASFARLGPRRRTLSACGASRSRTRR